MAPGERKVAAGEEAGLAAGLLGDAADASLRTQDLEVDRREGEVRGQAERETSRQEEAVARPQADGFACPFDDEPALAGEQGVALDPVMPRPLNGEIALSAETARCVARRFQQRQDFGKRIHGGRVND